MYIDPMDFIIFELSTHVIYFSMGTLALDFVRAFYR